MIRCGLMTVLFILALVAAASAGPSFEDKVKGLVKKFSQALKSGKCAGEKIGESKVFGRLKDLKGKSEITVDSLVSFVAAYGMFDADKKPFKTEKDLVESMQKDGVFGKGYIKKFAKECVSKCSQLMDKKAKQMSEELMTCWMETFVKICVGSWGLGWARTGSNSL